MYEPYLSFKGEEQDDLFNGQARWLRAQLREVAQRNRALSKWLYLDYADVDQNPLSSYGAPNVQLMQDVAKKYDPKGYMQTLVPGGFKISRVSQGISSVESRKADLISRLVTRRRSCLREMSSEDVSATPWAASHSRGASTNNKLYITRDEWDTNVTIDHGLIEAQDRQLYTIHCAKKYLTYGLWCKFCNPKLHLSRRPQHLRAEQIPAASIPMKPYDRPTAGLQSPKGAEIAQRHAAR